MLKKVIIGLQVVILLVMFFLLYKVYQPTEPAKYVFDDKGKASSNVTENDVIVYYKLDSFMTKSNYIDSIKISAKNTVDYYGQKLRKLEEDYQRTESSYAARQQAKQMTALEEQQAVEVLRQKQGQFQEENEKAQGYIDDLQGKVAKHINEAILKTINELNTRKKIKFVLAYQETSQEVMPTKGAIDVTSDMVEIINNLYKTKRK